MKSKNFAPDLIFLSISSFQRMLTTSCLVEDCQQSKDMFFMTGLSRCIGISTLSTDLKKDIFTGLSGTFLFLFISRFPNFLHLNFFSGQNLYWARKQKESFRFKI